MQRLGGQGGGGDGTRGPGGGAGWFPQAFVGPADQQRMHELQVSLSRKLDGALQTGHESMESIPAPTPLALLTPCWALACFHALLKPSECLSHLPSSLSALAEAKNVAAAARIKLAQDAVKIKELAEERAHNAYEEMRAEAQAMARTAEQASAATKEQSAKEKAAAAAVAKAAEEEAAKANIAANMAANMAKKAEKERVEAQKKAELEVKRIKASYDDPVAPPATWTATGKIPPDFANDGGTHGDRRFRKTAPVREGTTEFNEVVKSFEKTLGGSHFKVVKVERVQNVALYQSYMMWLLHMRHR